MSITIALTQALGILLTVMGISIVIDRKNVSVAMEELTQNRGFMWLWGFITLTIGIVLIVLNNIWTSGLPLFITILGWLTLIKGIFIIVFPDSAISLYRKVNKDSMFIFGGLIAFVLGLILLYLGFTM